METNDNVSDLHIAADNYISYRVNGEIIKQTQFGKLTNEFMELAIRHLMQSDSDRVAKFRSQKDMDFAYISKSGMSYRVNAFMKVGRIAVVMRKINSSSKQIEDLMYADIADSIKNNILIRKTGLFLVT